MIIFWLLLLAQLKSAVTKCPTGNDKLSIEIKGMNERNEFKHGDVFLECYITNK